VFALSRFGGRVMLVPTRSLRALTTGSLPVRAM
jgi:hypothetical protein